MVEFPFTPSKKGQTMTKDQMVTAIQLLATKMGFEMKAAEERDAWTGHVFRISGPRHLSRFGVQVSTILLLGLAT